MVLEEGGQEEPHSAQHTHNHEHPQEQPVDHHGDVLPVLHDLWADKPGTQVSAGSSLLSPSPLSWAGAPQATWGSRF